MEKALNILRTAIANQMDWKDIQEIVEEAAENGDPILSRIRKLKLDINHFTMMLSNPFLGKLTRNLNHQNYLVIKILLGKGNLNLFLWFAPNCSW